MGKLLGLFLSAAASGFVCWQCLQSLKALRPEMTVASTFVHQIARLRSTAVAFAVLTGVTALLAILGWQPVPPSTPADHVLPALWTWGTRLGWLAIMFAVTAVSVVVVYGPALAYESRLRKMLSLLFALVVLVLAVDGGSRLVFVLMGGA